MPPIDVFPTHPVASFGTRRCSFVCSQNGRKRWRLRTGVSRFPFWVTDLVFCFRLSSLLPLSSDPRCSHAYLFSLLLLRLFPLAARSFVCGSATAVTYHSHPSPLNIFTPSSFGFLFPWIDPLPLSSFYTPPLTMPILNVILNADLQVTSSQACPFPECLNFDGPR